MHGTTCWPRAWPSKSAWPDRERDHLDAELVRERGGVEHQVVEARVVYVDVVELAQVFGMRAIDAMEGASGGGAVQVADLHRLLDPAIDRTRQAHAKHPRVRTQPSHGAASEDHALSPLSLQPERLTGGTVEVLSRQLVDRDGRGGTGGIAPGEAG